MRAEESGDLGTPGTGLLAGGHGCPGSDHEGRSGVHIPGRPRRRRLWDPESTDLSRVAEVGA